QNVNAVTNLLPDLADEILQKVDQPLTIGTDTKENREYLLCEFNRDGDSHRSPISNQYFPPMEGGLFPSPDIRSFEEKANIMFDTYRKLYFDTGLCNVYGWDKPDGTFACVIVIKKDITNYKGVERATWDSFNVVDISLVDQASATLCYKITSS